ncbi:MAG TPA: hypothetical protein VND65_11265 [Candidatus Binatia bacterium]|nr:hypothetical protein [Candidatus Binatia bacterium]
MILNAWTLQTSSSDPDIANKAAEYARHLILQYNDVLQNTIDVGWEYLRDQVAHPNDYFNLDFYTYVTGKFVADPPLDSCSASQPEALVSQCIAGRLMKRQMGTPLPKENRQKFGVCPADKYCLGYANIFQPLHPRLTDLLLAVIAGNDPYTTTMAAINRMEDLASGYPQDFAAFQGDCFEKDRHFDPNDEPASLGHEHFFLECFRGAAAAAFLSSGEEPGGLGLLRASLADFLFNYKQAQFYPHEFSPYELSHSAQQLDTALAPLVDAFNRDLAAYQLSVSERIIAHKAKEAPWAGAEKATFINNGLITVRTLSGFETVVNTTSQSFLDATQQPTVSALLSSIEGAHGTGVSTSSATGMTDVLQNISPIQAQVIMGTLAAVQTSKVQIGRSLNIDITPRSLAGASSAELTVKLNADESASPTYYNPSQSTAADLSRVANHDTTTKVRVDSIKLFDVSTLTAELQKSRTRFPLLPPFVEIPYIGTLIGVPLPSAKEFHNSTVMISAIIVPTAADIALDLEFFPDRLVDSNGASRCTWPDANGNPPAPDSAVPRCNLRLARSFSDIDSTGITHFHREMVSCIANRMHTGHAIFDTGGHPALSNCWSLSLQKEEWDSK